MLNLQVHVSPVKKSACPDMPESGFHAAEKSTLRNGAFCGNNLFSGNGTAACTLQAGVWNPVLHEK
jgi:hypothetical protein